MPLDIGDELVVNVISQINRFSSSDQTLFFRPFFAAITNLKMSLSTATTTNHSSDQAGQPDRTHTPD